jgi:hypothetical protein
MTEDAARLAWRRQALHALVGRMVQLDELASEPNRTTLINLIEEDLRVEEPSASLPVARNPIGRLDLMAVARECLRARGGVRALRAAARLMFGESGPGGDLVRDCNEVLDLEPGMLADQDRDKLLDLLDGIALAGDADVPTLFIEATRPVPAPTTVSTTAGAVRQLERRGTAIPLLRFLELLANHNDHPLATDGLRAWIDEHLPLIPAQRRTEVTQLRDGRGRWVSSAAVRTCLVVRIEPAEDDTYPVMAWLGQTDSTFGPNEGPDDVVTLSELQHWLRQCIKRYAHGALNPHRRPLVEFALPPSHLNEPVDTWKLDDGTPLGVRYQVTVRPLNRPEPVIPLIADRWKTLVAGADAEHPAPESMRWLHSTTTAPADDPLLPAWAWIAVTCPLMSRHPAAADAVLATGTPVAAWLRGEKLDSTRRAVLDGLSRGRLVTQFPDAVRKFRENGWHDGGDHRDLVLLWDDPTRPPPQSYLVNAPERRA